MHKAVLVALHGFEKQSSLSAHVEPVKPSGHEQIATAPLVH